MGEILAVVVNLSVLVFVITSMLAMGVSLTVKPIIGRTWELPALVNVK